MAANQPGAVFVKSGTVKKLSLWALTAANKYTEVSVNRARLRLIVAGALSGLAAIDGATPAVGDTILVSQGTPATDGIYLAQTGAWTPIVLISALPDGFQCNVWAGNSAPYIYVAQG